MKKINHVFAMTFPICVCVLVTQSCLILCDPVNCVAHQAALSMDFSRKEYWSGLPCPSPGDLPDSRIEPGSPALQVDSLLSKLPGKPFSVSDQIRSDQLRPTLCDPMNRSTPGLPVHHQLPKFTETHVHRVSDAIQPSHPLSSPYAIYRVFNSLIFKFVCFYSYPENLGFLK